MAWHRVESLLGKDNLQRLAQSRIGVVGLGSGGGFVALSLAMSGVGSFVLFDDDLLEEGNVVRHVCDRRYVGQNKAFAVADLIKARNPKAEVRAIEARLEANDDVLDGLDLLIVAVDGENAKYRINELCLKRNLNAIYAGVYERGEGGDVVVIRPYDGPCYACWSEEVRGGAPVRLDEATQELDYGMIGQDGTLESEPGLWTHVTKVASVQTDLALNELLKGTNVSEEMPANTIILANNYLEIVDGQMSQPHTALWVSIERDPNCLVCGERMRLTDASKNALSLDDLMNDGDAILEELQSQDKPE